VTGLKGVDRQEYCFCFRGASYRDDEIHRRVEGPCGGAGLCNVVASVLQGMPVA
jgi:hypothetical protein